MGRPAAMTKIGAKRVHEVRCRGGNMKYRALRLDTGNFSWGTEVATMKVPVLDVVYNASNNELVRTKTLVKGAIVLVDAKPFQKWYQNHYGVEIGKKKVKAGTSKFAEEFAEKHPQKHADTKKKYADRQKTRVLAQTLDDQFSNGRLLACVSSRPGQTGRCDGYILEGRELDFYQRQLAKKKSKK
jgi:small subunit ribosomal protein S8e